MLKISEKKLLAFLLGWSLLLHLTVGLLVGPPNFWDHYEGKRYLRLAERFAQGKDYQGYLVTMPLYPLALAALLLLFGHASLPLLLLHAGLGVSVVLLTFSIARMLFLQRLPSPLV